MRLAAIVLLLLTWIGTAKAHDGTSDSIFLGAQPGAEATLLLTRRVQEPGRKVLMSVDLRVLSGKARIEFTDSGSGETLASSDILLAEELGAGQHFVISAEKSLARATRAVQIRVVAMDGESEVMNVVLQEVEEKILEEDFSDLEALRKAAAELDLGLQEGRKVGAQDHASTCNDPSHNHGHDHGHDHGHTHDHSGHSHDHSAPAAEPQSEPKESEELRKLRDRIRELEKANGELEQRVRELETPTRTQADARRAGVVRLCSLRKDPLEVVVSLPVLSDLVRRIGGDHVTTSTLCAPGTDPHDVRMTPALIAGIENADLLVESGMGLESWVERAIAASGNADIGRGKPGHVFATNGVTPLEVPSATELAAGGHVHAAGNPHAWLSPLNLKVMAANVEKGLARLDVDRAPYFAKRRSRLEREIDERLFGPELVKLLGSRYLDRLHRAGKLIPFLEKKKLNGRPLIESLGGWLAQARNLESRKLITYHKTWTYLVRCLDLEVVATIEEKPGIAPSPAHLARLAKTAREGNVKVVVAPPYYPRNRIDALAKQIGGASVVLPTQPGESQGAKDALSLFDDILMRLARRT